MIPATQLADLWRCHADGLALLARSRCGPDEASDCVQTAFVKLATSDPPPHNIPAWLATVVRNEAIARVRARSRRREKEGRAAAEKFNAFEFSSADHLAKQTAGQTTDKLGDWTQIQIDQLNEAMSSLSSGQRELIVARIWNGLGFREIAQMTGRSKSQVHREYQTSLNQLRIQLVQHGTAFEDLITTHTG